MTIEEYAEQQVIAVSDNCNHLRGGICADCVVQAIIKACTDQKRAAVAALEAIEKSTITSVYDLIYKDKAVEAVVKSTPITAVSASQPVSAGEMEVG